MNKKPLFTLLIVSIGFASCSEDPVLPTDTSIPTISKLEYSSEIEPYPGQVIPWNWNLFRYYLNISDPEGISEVILGVKGDLPNNAEGDFSNKFELLNHTETINKDYDSPKYYFQPGRDEINFDPFTIEWRGTFSVATLPILAGPYQLSIDAQDINGNKTNYELGTNYQTIVFVERTYAPLIHRPHGLPDVITLESNDALSLEGGIMRTDDEFSTPLKFVWIKLADQDVVGDYKGETEQIVYEERMWGQSLRLDKSGSELPSASELTFNQLLEVNPMKLPEGKSNFVMIVWAEDEAGNASRKTIPIEIN
ncbi:hypothetical protein JYB64_01615 [Algoriphagus aestuarii]|nr:hypothetical protein [Algoriphagus aestuarii]